MTGDFDGDGRTDFALSGVYGWDFIPVALSNDLNIGGTGPGHFKIVNNQTNPYWGLWSSTANVSRLVGDFNGDKISDIALTGSSGWQSIPMAKGTLSPSRGSFIVTNGATLNPDGSDNTFWDLGGWASVANRLIGNVSH